MAVNIYLRVIGYVGIICVHVSNSVYMLSFHQGDVMKDPRIRAYIGVQFRFITCWNFIIQIHYACVGLICDILTLIKSRNKNYEPPQFLTQYRDILFCAIVWPSTFVVASLFWPFYLYDKNLVFPDFIDKLLPPVSNHIIHTFIVPVVLWEVMLYPRKMPKDHMKNAVILFAYTASYFIVLFYTFIEQRIWIYPIFEKAEGSIYTPLLVVYAFVLANIHYRTQWILNYYLWGKPLLPIPKRRLIAKIKKNK